jgi:hypothetical protein
MKDAREASLLISNFSMVGDKVLLWTGSIGQKYKLFYTYLKQRGWDQYIMMSLPKIGL